MEGLRRRRVMLARERGCGGGVYRGYWAMYKDISLSLLIAFEPVPRTSYLLVFTLRIGPVGDFVDEERQNRGPEA